MANTMPKTSRTKYLPSSQKTTNPLIRGLRMSDAYAPNACRECREAANDIFDPEVHVGYGDFNALYRELRAKCTHDDR